MKNYFVIHGSFGNSKEHYFPWLVSELTKFGEVVCLDFPIGVGNQNYVNWEQVIEPYKSKINKDTVFIGRSIAPVFIAKFLMKNDLYIDKLISISGFNNYSVDEGEYDEVNKSMFVTDLANFKNHCKNTVCFISENDPYVKFDALCNFANIIADEVVNIKDGGHFNSDSGYGEKFEKILEYID